MWHLFHKIAPGIFDEYFFFKWYAKQIKSDELIDKTNQFATLIEFIRFDWRVFDLFYISHSVRLPLSKWIETKNRCKYKQNCLLENKRK